MYYTYSTLYEYLYHLPGNPLQVWLAHEGDWIEATVNKVTKDRVTGMLLYTLDAAEAGVVTDVPGELLLPVEYN